MKQQLLIIYISAMFAACSLSGAKRTGRMPGIAANAKVSVLDFGARGDGRFDNTAVLQQAIEACAAKSATLVFPTGVYYTRPLFLRSNISLQLDEGAVILGSPDKSAYDKLFPNASPIETSALIYGREVRNVKITGKGKIDGQGGSEDFRLGNDGAGRPKLVFFVRSQNITLEDITLTNAAFWTCHFLACDTVKVKGIRIYSHSNWNNDGLDIDARHVEVSDCVIDVDDDGVCLKSDRDVFCEHVKVRNCIIKTNCNGIKLGTASKKGFRDIDISGCRISKASEDNFRHWMHAVSWAGISQEPSVVSGIALECVDGGMIDSVHISGITMTDVQTPVFIRLGDRSRPYSGRISSLKNVVISGVQATAVSRVASSITGVPGSLVENVLVKDMQVTLPGGGMAADTNAVVPQKERAYPENRMFGVVLPAYGFYVRNAKHIRFEQVNFHVLQPDGRPDYKFDATTDHSISQ